MLRHNALMREADAENRLAAMFTTSALIDTNAGDALSIEG